jgi:hypothetical protein
MAAHARIGFGSLSATALAVVGVAAAADELPRPGYGLVLPNAPYSSGKPLIFTPPVQDALPPPQSDNCPPALPCGTRLMGTVQRNGAVELQVPAWRW